MLQLSDIEAVTGLRGEPSRASAAGITRAGNRLLTLENPSPFDQPSRDLTQPASARQAPRRRLVIVAGLDGDERGARAALGAVEWFKRRAPGAVRDRWAVSALPLADPDGTSRARPFEFPPQKGFFDHPEEPESRYAWRWTTYQAPDVLLEIRGGDALARTSAPAGSLAAAMAGGSEVGTVATIFATATASDGAALLQQVLTEMAAARPSEIHATLDGRVSRDPVAIASVLAERYPQNPIVSYIPSVAWANTLRLADLTNDDGALRRKVMEQVRPWLSRERPLFGERFALTAVAGTMIYADLAERGEEAARDLAVQGAEAASRLAPSGFAQHGNGWTDDMFMMSTILARSGRMSGREHDLNHLATVLISYAGRLQREDGIFVHFTGRVPWGRGNGFAALGLTEALTSLASAHPSRASVLEIYRQHMNGLRAMQAPDGMWRQVIDEPGSFREESATAMTLTAMARGVRLGWLDESYRPIIDRAWRALAAHVTSDGAIVDICTGTGSGPDLRYYLDRAAINGYDDRGGAMALLAATEMIIFRR